MENLKRMCSFVQLYHYLLLLVVVAVAVEAAVVDLQCLVVVL